MSRSGRTRSGEGVIVVAALVEAVLLRALRRRGEATVQPPATRLVGEAHPVDSLGFVDDGTSALVRRPGAPVEVRPAGSLVVPSLLGRTAATYVVVSHAPMDVWLRVGPFETLDGRVVQEVELELTVAVGDSRSGLAELADPPHAEPHDLGEVGDVLLDRLAREVADRTTDAVRRRTLRDLTELSLGVLLDGALPATFLGGLVTRSRLQVTDVDWPTEGRGWSTSVGHGSPDPAGEPGPVLR